MVVVVDGVLVDWELKVVVFVDWSELELKDVDEVLSKVVVVDCSVVVMVIPVVEVDDGALDVLHPLSVDICLYVALLLSKFSFAVPYKVIASLMNSFSAELVVSVPIDSSIVMISLTRVIRDSSSPIIRSNE